MPYINEYSEDTSGFSSWENWYSDQYVLDNVEKIAVNVPYYTRESRGMLLSGTACFAITTDHKLYGWGSFGFTRESGIIKRLCLNRPTLMAENVKDAAVTSSELFIINERGDLQWASLDELGNLKELTAFHTINCGNTPMEFISFGSRHFLALNAMGQLFSGGSNDAGQVGLKDAKNDDSLYMYLNRCPPQG